MSVTSGECEPQRGIRSLALALCCAAGLIPVGGVAAGSATSDKPATHSVVIDGVKYVPETLVVKRGDTIVWVNKDPFPHTVTMQGAFDSHDIAPGKQWKYTPHKVGEYPYICTLHPNMKGTLKVE